MILLLTIIILILIAGFFTAAEAALSSINKDDLDNAEVGITEAKKNQLEKLLNDLDRLHAITQIGVSITLISVTTIVIQVAEEISHDILLIGFTIPFKIVGLIGLVIVYWIFGILIPKGIGKKNAYEISRAIAGLYVFFFNLLHYPIEFIIGAANFLLKPFKIKTSFSYFNKSEDELRALISEGLKHGTINKTEHEILQNVFEFNDLRANEIMVPRTEMSGVELSDDDEEMLKEILKNGHSMVPVYQDSFDNILGIIHTKDIFRTLAEKQTLSIRSMIRPAYFVPETKLISEILKDMQTRGIRLTIITDEYGGTEGVLTLEDIISEIVGEIGKEGEVKILDYTKLPDNSYVIFGSMTVDDFNETFNSSLPFSEEYTTIAGFVSFISGKILNPGEKIDYANLEIELIKKLKQKMIQFRFRSKTGEFHEIEKLEKGI
jgi:putative hemolysin